MKRSEPLMLGEILDQMMTRVAHDPETRRAYLESIWPRIAGEHIAAYTNQVRLEGRLLHVYVQSASLKEQLGYLREKLVRQFNEQAGESAIDNILLH